MAAPDPMAKGSFPCKQCGTMFSTMQALGAHVSSIHKGTRKVRRARATKAFALEVIVRTHASPAVENRITFHARSANELQERYRSLVTLLSTVS